jgi:hypothetical protein
MAGRLAIPIAVVLGVLLPLRDASAQQRRRAGFGYESRVDTTFAFDKNGAVHLMAVSGDITVNGWSRNEIRVRAISDDDNIRFTGSSARVTLEIAGGRRGGDTRFELSVPFGTRVTAESQNGDIMVRGTRGAVELHAQNGDVDVDDVMTRLEITSLNGDVTAKNITGDCAVNSMNGEVQLTDVRGTVEASTVSGDIDLRGIVTKLVRAKTTSGDVMFDGTIDPAGRYELTSHSGDIGLRIPRDASAQLTVSTWSGTVDSEFPIMLKPGDLGIGPGKSKRYVFDIGSGGARITVEAFSGDINISSSGRSGGDR